MAWISLVLACMYFALNSSVIAVLEMPKTSNGNQDWKLAMKKIEELQNIVRYQEDRITSLEKRPNESTEQVAELQHTLKKQSNRITQLETRVVELEAMLKEETRKELTAMHAREQEVDSSQTSYPSNNDISELGNGTCINLFISYYSTFHLIIFFFVNSLLHVHAIMLHQRGALFVAEKIFLKFTYKKVIYQGVGPLYFEKN